MQLRGEDRTSVTELQNLLKQTADVYRSLVQHAKAASVPVPSEAQLGTGVKRGPDELEYDEFAAANATDWDDFQDEGADFCCNEVGSFLSHVLPTFLWLDCTAICKQSSPLCCVERLRPVCHLLLAADFGHSS